MPPSLLVLDNFPENDPVRRYLPTTGRVHTIVTTRRRDLGSNYPQIRLGMLSVDEGVRLLNSGERKIGTEAAQLVERLGGLPLALELTKSFLNYRMDVRIAELLMEIQGVGEIEILKEFASEYRDELPNRHERDVASTFEISCKLAPNPARDILQAMAEVAPTPVPRSLMRRIVKASEQIDFKDSINASIAELSRLSLIDTDSKGNPFSHRLVLAFVRHRNASNRALVFERCREVVQAELDRIFANPTAADIRELELLVPRAEALSIR